MLDQPPYVSVWQLPARSTWVTNKGSRWKKCMLGVRNMAPLILMLASTLPLWAQSDAAPNGSSPAGASPATGQAPATETRTTETPETETETEPGPPATDNEPFPDLSVATDASIEQLEALVKQAKQLRPRNPDQYQAMQTAIRDASKRLAKLLDKEQDAKRRQQAELDAITSTVALMAFIGEDSQHKTLEQVHEFLKGRKELSLQDTQTGMLAATMLELQPNKQPARDTYQLLCDLLENDPREEMQSLRLNLQASIRRLDLLGNKFDLQATALDGQEIRIEDYAGKFVIVDFFASWCEPCLTDMPHLKQQFVKYQDKGLAVIAVSLDTDAAALEKYLQQAELPWPVIHDNAENPLERLQMKFGVSHLPTVLLLNNHGTVISLEARGAELQRLMEMLFETPTLAEPQATATEEEAGEQSTEQSNGKSVETTESLIEPEN